MTDLFDSLEALPDNSGRNDSPEPDHSLRFNQWPEQGWFDGSADLAEMDTDYPVIMRETDYATLYDDGRIDVHPDATTCPEWLWSAYNQQCIHGCWMESEDRLLARHCVNATEVDAGIDEVLRWSGWLMNLETGELTPPQS